MSGARNLAARGFARVLPLASPLRRVPLVGDALHRLSRAIVPSGTLVPVRVKSGIAAGLLLSLDARVAYASFRAGTAEPAVQEALRSVIGPGQVFYDMGANIGYFALAVARMVGPEGHVYAFEPDPVNIEQLEVNARLNELDNVTVVMSVVWSSSGSVSFARADAETTPSRGLGHVDHDGEGKDSIQVTSVSLDDFIRDNRAPDLIKSDVEGAEVEVFDGAAATLRSMPTILCEMHSDGAGRELFARFERLGYRCSWLDDMHVLAQRP